MNVVFMSSEYLLVVQTLSLEKDVASFHPSSTDPYVFLRFLKIGGNKSCFLLTLCSVESQRHGVMATYSFFAVSLKSSLFSFQLKLWF